jgi:ATP-dependent DNA helicase RecQ
MHRGWRRGVVLADAGDRLTVFFDEVGYEELLTDAVISGHVLEPAGA